MENKELHEKFCSLTVYTYIYFYDMTNSHN